MRYSLKNPLAYIQANLRCFVTLLEAVKEYNKPVPITYASSSSVYGLNELIPFSEKHRVDSQASLYGATKKANENLAHVYHHLHGLKLTGLRFFTVYGPYGRPDMAYWLASRRRSWRASGSPSSGRMTARSCSATSRTSRTS